MTGLVAGAASADITPPVGIPLAGWCFGPSRGVHDPLRAKVLVLAERSAGAAPGAGSGPLVLITADLIGLGTEYASRLRDRVARDLATGRERVAVCCSHTHSGPGAMPLRRWGPIDADYLEATLDRIREAVLEAAGRMEPVTVATGEGRVPGICDNRRGDRGNVVDESLPVIVVTRCEPSGVAQTDGGRAVGSAAAPLAVVMNYACHPVAAHNDRNLISADYPGFARRVVETAFGPAGEAAAAGTTALFTLGAAGDVNPVDLHRLEYAERYGRQVGEEAVQVIDRTAAGGEARPPGRATVLDAVTETVELPVQPLPSAEWLREEITRWREEAERLTAPGQHPKREDALIKAEWAREALEVVTTGTAASHLTMELDAMRIGDAALLAVPGELFVEIGMNIKARSPFEHTIICELANGSLCYLPTAEAYARGGYETEFSAKVYGLYMLTREAQPIIESAAGRMLNQFYDRPSGHDHDHEHNNQEE